MPDAHGRHGANHRHGHGHGEGPPRHRHGDAPTRALLTALLLTVAFAMVEVVVGLWSGSLALLADAGHMVNDAAALSLSLFVSWVATRPADRRMTFGYRRAEVVGALVNGGALMLASFWILSEAIERFFDPPDVLGVGVMVAASVGLLINLLSAWILHRHGGDSVNVRAAFLHVLSDALGSVAALIAGIFVLLFGADLADPIASGVIALLILTGAIRLVSTTVRVLMQAAPVDLPVEEVEAAIHRVEGVTGVPELRLWEIVPGERVLTAHVEIGARADALTVLEEVRVALAATCGDLHATVEPERSPVDEG
jgi:cobalt-zinc-cadmium efflux system protein